MSGVSQEEAMAKLKAAAVGRDGSRAEVAASLVSVVDAAAAGLSLSPSSSGSLEVDQAEFLLGEYGSVDGGSSSETETASADGTAAAVVDGSWRPTVDDMAASASRPVLVAAHPGLPYQRVLPGVDPCNLPVNDGSAIPFETPLFSGRACVWLRGVPGPDGASSSSSSSSGADAMFEGRKRRTLVTVQGRFRQPLPLDDVVTGQEFGRVENLPPAWLVDGVLLRVARAVSPSMEIGPKAAPYMLMPVISGCSEMHAALPGEEPPLAEAPREDLRAWDPSLAAPDGSPLPAAKRKAFFSKPSARVGRSFPTDLVFTFYFYQHVVDVAKYELDVLYRFDLCRYLAGQPLQMMMRQRSTGQYLYSLHLWHERLLQGDCRPRALPKTLPSKASTAAEAAARAAAIRAHPLDL